MFGGAQQLPSAHQLVFELASGRRTLSRCWEMRYAAKRRKGEAATLDALGGLVRRAVRKQMMSDVPLGSSRQAG